MSKNLKISLDKAFDIIKKPLTTENLLIYSNSTNTLLLFLKIKFNRNKNAIEAIFKSRLIKSTLLFYEEKQDI